MQDAYFLAELLEEGTEEALQKYEAIRRPIGVEVVFRTTLLTKAMTLRCPIAQSMRNFLVRWLLKSQKIRKKVAMTLSQLIYKTQSGRT